MKKEILRMEGLTIQGNRRQVEDVRLLVREGECVVLTGLNNAGAGEICELFDGKGTLEKGALFLSGQRVAEIQRSTMKNRRICYLDSKPPVFKGATLAECLFLLRNHCIWKVRASERVMNQQANELFCHYGLPFSAGQKNYALSRAERQLFWLVWAASQHARLIVLHEPERDLTMPEIQEMVRLILQLKEEGVSFLIGTGRASNFFAAADQVVCMRAGRIQKKLMDPDDFFLCSGLMQSKL